MLLGPDFGSDVLDLPVGHRWQSGEDVSQVGERIDTPTSAGFDDRVEDGAALAGGSLAKEEPILFTDRGGADRVFDQVVVYALPKASSESGFQSRRATSLQPEALGAIQEVTNELKYYQKRAVQSGPANHAGRNAQ